MIQLAAYTISPIFVLTSALVPYWCPIILGRDWNAVPGVAQPLFLLGSIQCVQFLNGPYLNALGKPSLATISTVVKSSSVVIALLLFSSDKLEQVIVCFAVAQLVNTPVSFFFVSRELSISPSSILMDVWPAFAGSFTAYVAVGWIRPMFEEAHPFVGLSVGLAMFLVIYVVVAYASGRRQMSDVYAFIRRRLRPRRQDPAVSPIPC